MHSKIVVEKLEDSSESAFLWFIQLAWDVEMRPDCSVALPLPSDYGALVYILEVMYSHPTWCVVGECAS